MEIIRSATFEGMADSSGYPTDKYKTLYEKLSQNGVRNIVTGFMFISNQGRAMHAGQAGMDSADKVDSFRTITDVVHKNGAKIYSQIAHTGQQTTGTGYEIVGISNKKSPYFNEKPRTLVTSEIYEIAERFANSAYYSQQAGFDGVQIHAAHGYLIHQFMLKSLNNRQDEFADKTYFLQLIIEKTREKCGTQFPVWVKISANVDIEEQTNQEFIGLIKFLDNVKVDLIEVSYGTMDYALNIFRGDVPVRAALKHNKLFANVIHNLITLPRLFLRFKKFTPMYNLEYAKIAKQHTSIPISVVGGFRSGKEIYECGMDYVSICRPLIREPDFVRKIENDKNYVSKCVNCNLCAVMADSKDNNLRCYNGRTGN